MKFINWLENKISNTKEDLIKLYQNLLNPNDIKKFHYLNKAVEDAYKSKNYKLAEKLEVELEKLIEFLDSQLEEMDDISDDDIGDNENERIDFDYSIQEEFAKIYAKYLRGDLLHGYEDVEIDSSYRQNPEFIKTMKSQGYAMAPKGAYERKNISAEKELANILRAAIYETPYIGMLKPRIDYIKSMSDDQIIEVARDAYESRKKMINRIKGFKEWLENDEKKYFSGDEWLRGVESGDVLQRIKFGDVKFDTIEKYYVVLDKAMTTITNIDNLRIGQKIADYVVSETPYWKIKDLDKEKNTIYLEPIPPNPYVPNEEGKIIGAGGHEFTAHDFDVMSGEYESTKIDKILDIINSKNYHDPRDIQYILLGTVPLQIGPNGSQGGWYNVSDRHNRGSMKGLSLEEIIKKDANTLKKLGFSVPPRSLDGTIDPYVWGSYVEGGYIPHNKEEESKLEEEDFSDPKKMAEIILSHKQPGIRNRNAEKLIRMYGNDESLESLVKEVAKKLAIQPQYGIDMDRNYDVKGKFIWLAWHKKWKDILDAFKNSPDPDNRRYVSYGYADIGDVDSVLGMMSKEESSETISSMLSKLWEIKFDKKVSFFTTPRQKEEMYKKLLQSDTECKKIINFICSNKNKIMDVLNSHPYHKKDGNIYLEKFINLCNLL